MLMTSDMRHTMSIISWSSILKEGCDVVMTTSFTGHDQATGYL